MAERELDPEWEAVARALRTHPLATSPPTGEVVTCAATAPIVDILAALYRDGCVIIDVATDPASCDAVLAEMTPHLESAVFGDGFLGRQTKRASAVVARSRASWGLVQHPLLARVCEAVLGRQILHVPDKVVP